MVLQVVHQFSHVHYHCHCWYVKKRDHSLRGNPLAIENTKWVERNLLTQQPISALVKKVQLSRNNLRAILRYYNIYYW
jgi:adenine-specific DNA glycosylase